MPISRMDGYMIPFPGAFYGFPLGYVSASVFHGTPLITPFGLNRLDLTHFVHGTQWVKCIKPIAAGQGQRRLLGAVLCAETNFFTLKFNMYHVPDVAKKKNPKKNFEFKKLFLLKSQNTPLTNTGHFIIFGLSSVLHWTRNLDNPPGKQESPGKVQDNSAIIPNMECLTVPCHKLPNNQALAGGVTVNEDAPACWSRLEIGSFWNAFAGAKKDFSAISKCMGKPASECIEFCYLNKRHRLLELAEAGDTNLLQRGGGATRFSVILRSNQSADDPISNTRAASIDADGSIWFRRMATRLLPLDGQNMTKVRTSALTSFLPSLIQLPETFHEITNKFTNVLPGPGFKIPVESNVLLAFKRIAAQMPHMTVVAHAELEWADNLLHFMATQTTMIVYGTLYTVRKRK
ncbi:hypothetical protein B0H14DRAFT_2568512 [Mycena olivaceomarginata]|nr:hypothetical protein B0H14DRAFT_2568512 [Mycena olivaceomarginata]